MLLLTLEGLWHLVGVIRHLFPKTLSSSIVAWFEPHLKAVVHYYTLVVKGLDNKV